MSSESEKVVVGSPVLPVGGLFGELSQGSDVTAEAIISAMFDENSNLSTKTNIPDAHVMVQIEMLRHDAEVNGNVDLVRFYDEVVLKGFRRNMMSFKGWRSEQAKDMVIADLEASRRAGEDSVRNNLVGGLTKK